MLSSFSRKVRNNYRAHRYWKQRSPEFTCFTYNGLSHVVVFQVFTVTDAKQPSAWSPVHPPDGRLGLWCSVGHSIPVITHVGLSHARSHGMGTEGLEARSARCRGEPATWGQHTYEGFLCTSHSVQMSHLSIHVGEPVYAI